MIKKLVKVVFGNVDKAYHYYSYDESIKCGCNVLVDANGQLTVANVIEVKDLDKLTQDETLICRNYKIKHVLSKIDFEIFKKGIEYEKRKETLLDSIRKRYEELEEMTKYKLMAEGDEKMRALIDELEAM